jgi:hypothetical protein
MARLATSIPIPESDDPECFVFNQTRQNSFFPFAEFRRGMAGPT